MRATIDWRGLCEELVNELHGYASANPHHDSDALVAHARAALAADPVADGPTRDELWELWLRLNNELPDRPAAVAEFWEHAQIDARAHYGHQPAPSAEGEQRHPAPVPVAERLPGPEDCDAEGRFWAWCKATKEWCLLNRWHYREESERNAPGWASGWPYWLPATALPLPQGEVAK